MNNYWLSPSGKVWSTPKLGGHIDLAFQIMKEKFKSDLENPEIDPIEYLESIGYIRYCDWGSSPGWVIPSNHKLTRQQKEKMFLLTGDNII
jgi:hypothetical protein